MIMALSCAACGYSENRAESDKEQVNTVTYGRITGIEALYGWAIGDES